MKDDVYIVAFTKDWNDVPTCTTHILREMAVTIPVIWVCSIGTRKPQVHSAKDWRRLAGRVIAGFRRAVLKETHLRVLRPILIPKAESGLARWINRLLFRWYLSREIPSRFKGRIEFWCFVPNAVDLIPVSGCRQSPESVTKIIYYCADDWTKFHHLDGEWMAAKERAIFSRADVVFATSRFLDDKFRDWLRSGGSQHPEIVYMPHGVDYAAFAKACDKRLPLPDDIANLPKPVVGFYGNLHPWVDFDLIRNLSAARPQWSFVLIGEIYSDIESLRGCRNIYLAGRREHQCLPDYCRGFDAAIIPYDMRHSRMESVNPVKAKELLAAGVPIVASKVPELGVYGDRVRCCEGLEEWLAALECQLRMSLEERRSMSLSVSDEDWSRKVKVIRGIVDGGLHQIQGIHVDGDGGGGGER